MHGQLIGFRLTHLRLKWVNLSRNPQEILDRVSHCMGDHVSLSKVPREG